MTLLETLLLIYMACTIFSAWFAVKIINKDVKRRDPQTQLTVAAMMLATVTPVLNTFFTVYAIIRILIDPFR